MKKKPTEKKEIKVGDRVWLRYPTNATVKSINKRYGLTILLDEVAPNTMMAYFPEDEVEVCAE